MYESFFSLEKAPFTLSPDPRFLYSGDRAREAFAGLLHGILNRRGFVVLTGESGTGKSTLIRAVLSEIPADKVSSSLIFNPMVKPEEFFELAMLDFGITDIPASKAQRLALFNQFLLDNHRAGKITVLFVDEAHTLTPELLEEIRLLTNFETSEAKLLQIVLAGHTELDDVLDQHQLRQLKQRIAVRISLRPLPSAAEVGRYMQHRWTRAGGDESAFPFAPEAIGAIAQYSNGVPRTINALCDNALVSAYATSSQTVHLPLIHEIARDLRLAAVTRRAAAPPSPPAAITPTAAVPPTQTESPSPAVLPVDDLDDLPEKPIKLLDLPVPQFQILGSKS